MDARKLVLLRALLRVAFREGEGQAARSLVCLTVERHGNAAAILLAWQPRDEDGGHPLVPSGGDHGARRIDDDDDFLARCDELLDHGHVFREELQRAAVPALFSLLRGDDCDDDICVGVAAALEVRSVGQAGDAIPDVHLRHGVAREAVPATAAPLRQRGGGASLLADESHLGILGQRQYSVGVLQHDGRFGDDTRGEVELARGIVVVLASVLAQLHLLAVEGNFLLLGCLRWVLPLLGLAEGVVLVDAGLPILILVIVLLVRLLLRGLFRRMRRCSDLADAPSAGLRQLGDALVLRGADVRGDAHLAGVRGCRPPTAVARVLLSRMPILLSRMPILLSRRRRRHRRHRRHRRRHVRSRRRRRHVWREGRRRRRRHVRRDGRWRRHRRNRGLSFVADAPSAGLRHAVDALALQRGSVRGDASAASIRGHRPPATVALVLHLGEAAASERLRVVLRDGLRAAVVHDAIELGVAEGEAVEAAALHEVGPAKASSLLLGPLRDTACEGHAGGHLHVEARLGGVLAVDVRAGAATGAGGLLLAVRCVPVGHHYAFETHSLFQVLVEDVIVGAGVGAASAAETRGALDQVVGAHHRRDAGVDGRLEGRVVDLKESALVDDFGHAVAVRLDRVGDPVLDDLHRRPVDLTEGLDLRLDHLCAKIRVLPTHVLAQTAVPRVASDVDAWAKLSTVGLAKLAGHLHGPTGH
mmetsp:Transcript_62869/g.205229  ORF Transcript_62869/g.205229 Transcript_62869/m.205229 type:complete len:701 (-) Transcript_62869:346-2448(-)